MIEVTLIGNLTADVMVRASIDDSDDEVQFAMADGYLTCCISAIVIAKAIQRELVKDRGEDND